MSNWGGAWCSYLAISMGKVLCCCLDFSSRYGHFCGCTYLGAKGHNAPRAISKKYEVGANYVVLLIVLCLLKCFVQVLQSKCLLSLGAILGGDKIRTFQV